MANPLLISSGAGNKPLLYQNKPTLHADNCCCVTGTCCIPQGGRPAVRLAVLTINPVNNCAFGCDDCAKYSGVYVFNFPYVYPVNCGPFTPAGTKAQCVSFITLPLPNCSLIFAGDHTCPTTNDPCLASSFRGFLLQYDCVGQFWLLNINLYQFEAGFDFYGGINHDLCVDPNHLGAPAKIFTCANIGLTYRSNLAPTPKGNYVFTPQAALDNKCHNSGAPNFINTCCEWPDTIPGQFI